LITPPTRRRRPSQTRTRRPSETSAPRLIDIPWTCPQPCVRRVDHRPVLCADVRIDQVTSPTDLPQASERRRP
jgi:hypothetical protein